MRQNHRKKDELRPVLLTRQYTKYAEGSVLVEYGDTKVLCTATFTNGVPPFLKDKGQGWVSAEYSMLPRATKTRVQREAAKGKQTGRTQEIQRLIGRALRGAINLKALGENTIIIDCDVLQADGGTRTASITGGCVALFDAISYALKQGKLKKNPCLNLVAALSVGIYQNEPLMDLDYQEDQNAETDMNIVMNEQGDFLEIQGTAENGVFNQKQLDLLLPLAKKGITELILLQKAALAK